jgi:uncharacterized damage-inducible protein DinB
LADEPSPPSLDQTYHAMACNNAWANHRLLAAVAGLDDEAFAAPRVGFFPSLKATLNHIHVVDLFYIDALEGGTLGPAAFDDPEPFASPAALWAAQRAMDRRLVDHCAGLSALRLATVVEVRRRDRIQRERRDRLLLHLFQHQIHHRGQAHAMLAATATPPPQLDEFFSADEAPLRAGDLAALGLDEGAIWRAGDGG